MIHFFGNLTCTERKKWSRNGSTVEPFSCPQDGPHFKEKMAPLLKSGAVFQNGSRVEPFWLHFFSVWPNVGSSCSECSGTIHLKDELPYPCMVSCHRLVFWKSVVLYPCLP